MSENPFCLWNGCYTRRHGSCPSFDARGYGIVAGVEPGRRHGRKRGGTGGRNQHHRALLAGRRRDRGVGGGVAAAAGRARGGGRGGVRREGERGRRRAAETRALHAGGARHPDERGRAARRGRSAAVPTLRHGFAGRAPAEPDGGDARSRRERGGRSEGGSTSGIRACAGWNPGRRCGAGVLDPCLATNPSLCERPCSRRWVGLPKSR